MATLTTLPTLNTPHLLLREMRQNDAEELASFVTQFRYQRFITHKLRNDAEVRAFVHRNILAQGDNRRRIYHLVAEEHMSGEVIGDAFIINHKPDSFEIGWGMHPALWRMGFGTEIGRALLATCFEKLRAKEAWCKVFAENSASRQLARRIGMVLTRTEIVKIGSQDRRQSVEVLSMADSSYFELPY